MKARKRAGEADVVVVNHHLFFADLALRDEGMADLLPDANTVIFDEAHHLPDLARLFFGQSMSTGQVIELAHDARLAEAQHAREGNEIGEAADGVEKAARDLRLALGPAAGRIALAQLRERTAFDRALDGLGERLAALAQRSAPAPRKSAPRRSATAASARMPSMRASASGAKPTRGPRRTRTARRPRATWCAGSRPGPTPRRSTSRRSTWGASSRTRWPTASAPGSSPRRPFR